MRERKPGARKETWSAKERAGKSQECGSANAKAQNLRPKKERKSASTKGSGREHKSTSAKAQKKHVPSSGHY
jgi:hypothetical protein